MNQKEIDFTKITLRRNISNRGGGLEIDLSSLGFKGQKMTAYQNYLGGGMLGKICNDCTVKKWNSNEKLVEIATMLSRYFFAITNPESEELESVAFEQNQKLPTSAY